jgi:hypothetical protein
MSPSKTHTNADTTINDARIAAQNNNFFLTCFRRTAVYAAF